MKLIFLIIKLIAKLYSNDCFNEKAKLKKWGLLSFTKKPKSTINLQKGVEGASLTEDGINQVKQLIEYLSKEQSKCRFYQFVKTYIIKWLIFLK